MKKELGEEQMSPQEMERNYHKDKKKAGKGESGTGKEEHVDQRYHH